MGVMLSDRELFIDTKPSRLVLRAAVPGAIGMVASSIYFTLEMLLIGRLIGQEAFAAANLVMPFILINFALSDLIAVGSSVRIAIRLGEGAREEADRLFSLAVVTCMILSAISAVVLMLAVPVLLSLMGADSQMIRHAMGYFGVYALFSPFTGLVFALDNYLRICGRIRFSMVMNILMAFMCLVFETVFLLVFDLGLPFAALGSSLGMTVTCLICLLRFARGRLALRLRRPRFDKAALADMVAQGLPTFFNNIAGRISSILMNSLLLRWGGAVAVSIYGVLMNVDGLIVPCMYGVFDSLQPAIGFNWGAGRKDRVRRIAFICLCAIAVISLSSFVIVETFPTEIHALFIDEGGDEALAVRAISIMGLTYLLLWLPYATQSFSSAIGQNKEASVLSLCRALIFPLLSMLVLSPFKLDGIWFVVPMSVMLTSLTAVVLFVTRLRPIIKDGARGR